MTAPASAPASASPSALPWTALAAGLCLSGLLAGVAVGATGWFTPVELSRRLAAGDEILLALRAPRVLMVAILGGSLALAGSIMQTLLRNDLADPYVLGLSGGASLGAVGSLAWLPGLPPGPAAALGAAGAAALVRGLTAREGDGIYRPERVLLAGVAVGSLLASVTGAILVLAPGDRLLRSSMFWLFGGVGTPPGARLVVPALLLAGALIWLVRRAERLDRLLLGDDVAATLGVPVHRLRRQAMVVAVLLTAAAVSVGGLVGFVGLVAPHAARRLAGATHRRFLPLAALLGASLVTVADVIARTAFAPRELPVGLITAAAGAPFFLALLRRRPVWA